MAQAKKQSRERAAFSPLCPPVEEVKPVLQELGFTLVRHIKASQYNYLAPLPDQYHFEGPQGLEIIFLAGKDIPEDGGKFPHHNLRWWVISGADQLKTQQVKRVLAAHWFLSWRKTSHDETVPFEQSA